MAHLVVRERGQVAMSFALAEKLSVGRHENNDLVVRGIKASRHHAVLEKRDGGWFVRDLGSRHGTLVNRAAAAADPLKDGDVVQIGDALITFRAADEPKSIA